MKTATNAELTSYPKLFAKCYWGKFREKADRISSIVENRNKFVSEFKIKKLADGVHPQNGLDMFDHCELYRCEEGFVYIISPYCDVEDGILAVFGLTRYRPLYANDAHTFFKKFESKVAFNRYLKKVAQLSEKIRQGNQP